MQLVLQHCGRVVDERSWRAAIRTAVDVVGAAMAAMCARPASAYVVEERNKGKETRGQEDDGLVKRRKYLIDQGRKARRQIRGEKSEEGPREGGQGMRWN